MIIVIQVKLHVFEIIYEFTFVLVKMNRVMERSNELSTETTDIDNIFRKCSKY